MGEGMPTFVGNFFWHRVGNFRNSCEKPELFHNLHRFFHKGYSQRDGYKILRLVDIKFWGGFRLFSTFSAAVFLTTGEFPAGKKDLTRSATWNGRKKPIKNQKFF